MLKARGLRLPDSHFELMLAIDCLVAATQESLMHGIPQHSHFDSREWDITLENAPNLSQITRPYVKLFKEFVKFPGLLHDIMVLVRHPNDDYSRLQDILNRAISVASSLETTWHMLEAAIDDPKVCQIKPSPTGDTLVPLVYEFHDTQLAIVLGYFLLLCDYHS